MKFKNSLLLWTMILCLVFMLTGQAAEIKWMKIGGLQNFFSEIGNESEESFVLQQQYGWMWPSFYSLQSMQCARGIWIGSMNYNDPVLGRSITYKVVKNGPRPLKGEEMNEFIPVSGAFKLYGKKDHSLVLVDGAGASDLAYDDIVDIVQEDLPYDRYLHTQVNTSMGVEMTRNIFAYCNPYYDNIIFFEYIFKNTGVYDINGNSSPQTLNGVYFHYQYRLAIAEEGNRVSEWGMPNSSRWGVCTINDAIRNDPANPTLPMRAQFAWHGRHSQCAWDNIGSPHFKGTAADGRLGSAQFIGTVTLHADKSVSDRNDDPLQPTTTQYIESDDPVTTAGQHDQYNPDYNQQAYNIMSAGHPALTHAQAVGDGFVDQFAKSGGYSYAEGFGPYTLAPGDSIRIVLADCAAGLNWYMCDSIGKIWMYERTPYLKPDGQSTTNKDEFKNAWVYTGKDSLYQTFRNAQEVIDNNFLLPSPPPAPDQFLVNSGGNRISLEWTTNAESAPGFTGYRVLRSVGKKDTTFQQIFACGGTTGYPVVNSYNDTTAQRGVIYYYYVVSYDNGTADSKGRELYSSPFYTRTNQGAYLRRPPEEGLEKIRIVPNPFNIANRNLQFPGEGDKVMFLNLPAECKIKIFTERGDKIWETNHANGSGDEAWYCMTSSNQIVVSGIYIVHFEMPDGESIFRKMIIIR